MTMRDKVTSRERVNLALRRQEADRIPRAESFWPETLPAWQQEGMPYGQSPDELFDYDIVQAGWVESRAFPGFEEIIREDAESVVRRDGNAAILRYWKHHSGTPEHIGFEVDGPDAWPRLRDGFRDIPIGQRVDLCSTVRAMHKARSRQRWFCWGGVECFEMAKDILGHEGMCVAAIEEPGWLQEIFETLADMAVRALDYLEANGVVYDGGWIYGDVAYNHGPFFSPAMYRALVLPAQKKQVAWFKQRGLPVIYHTDGDFRPLLPMLLELGVDCLQPLEAKANIDVRALKPAYGDRLAFMGNIDVTKLLTNDRAVIEEEVAHKIPMAMRGGGYIYHSDHSIPPGVTWSSYLYLMQLVDFYGRYA